MTTISEMKLQDYGYNTKKDDVLREKALTSAFREKGAGWVNKQMRDMLRVAREQESIILFKDKCNFIGSSTEKETKKIMDEYEEILLNMVIHTKNYDFVHKEFLDYAVIQIGWRNLCKELENLKNNKQGVKVSEKIKKDMDYVIEVYNNEHEDKCVSSEDNHKCKCVSSEEIRTIVREELSKMFGELKKINEDIRKMYAEMIV